eukprot:SAG11_NODE_36475_length_261_cov_0.944444_1_plen_46_part_01
MGGAQSADKQTARRLCAPEFEASIERLDKARSEPAVPPQQADSKLR